VVPWIRRRTSHRLGAEIGKLMSSQDRSSRRSLRRSSSTHGCRDNSSRRRRGGKAAAVAVCCLLSSARHLLRSTFHKQPSKTDVSEFQTTFYQFYFMDCKCRFFGCFLGSQCRCTQECFAAITLISNNL
jgi:hypothetical protein